MNTTPTPADITIAITVYDRREFLEQAIESALNQTVPVKVMVVEDCGPDLTLQPFVRSKYGARIEYIRNPQRRGLFDNWNACVEYCQTPWLSILHDDDYLKPTFVETILRLSQSAPGRGLYFGNNVVVNSKGEVVPFGQPVITGDWQDFDLPTLADRNILTFAGHLFPVEYAKRVGGFRASSIYCGDWEMWFKLSAQFGGVLTGKEVVVVRYYEDWKKGTSKVVRAGRNHAATIVQRKRNLAYLKGAGLIEMFNPRLVRNDASMSVKNLIIYGADFSERMFLYNVKLFQAVKPSSFPQKIFQAAVRVLGPGFVRCISKLWRLWVR